MLKFSTGCLAQFYWFAYGIPLSSYITQYNFIMYMREHKHKGKQSMIKDVEVQVHIKRSMYTDTYNQ